MPDLTTSVLIPSFRRPETLRRCLEALAAQDTLPNEVIVVWQGDDTPTRDAAEQIRGSLPFTFHVLHSPEKGVVVSENLALDAASGQIILLIDDDAFAPPHWLRSHLKHYADPTIGAVGGPADNFYPDGGGPRRRAREPVGCLTWYGNVVGNMYDQDESWRSRPPRLVDHLVGYNLSLRRSAFDRFEQALRPYWNLFELDACLQVAAAWLSDPLRLRAGRRASPDQHGLRRRTRRRPRARRWSTRPIIKPTFSPAGRAPGCGRGASYTCCWAVIPNGLVC